MRSLLVGIILLIYYQLGYAQDPLTPGTIGVPQTVCYNTAPAALTQLTAPTGGTGAYTYQWQSSPDNSTWTNIAGATLSGYSPPALSASTYYRRTVTSGGYTPVNSTPLLITVSPQITLAQLHDNISIDNNTSTNINVVISGGTSPFTINYTRNGVGQTAINNYSSGTNISTGVLTTGVYTYALTSVTDAHGCAAQSLGTNITVTVTENSGSLYVPVDSLFRIETPLASSNDRRYELGTEFLTLSNGFITKARLFSHVNEGGDHIIRLWMLNGSAYTLIAGPYTWNFSSGVQGWREFELPSPIAVNANQTLIVAITNSTDQYYVKSEYFSSATSNEYVKYLKGLYTTSIGSVPASEYHASCYFRDIVFSTSGANGNLTAGTIGNSQTICYSTTPAPLIQLTAPTGGTGVYTYQWQSSPDNTNWINISGATLSGYSPPVLTASRYYRRTVTSGSYTPVNSNSVLIAVSPQVTLAQLHDNVTIYNNTSTNFNISFTGGTSPYTVNYTRNGAAQTTITNYNSGTNISTGVLTTGVYTYILTSVTDAYGCASQSLGTSITVTVTEAVVETTIFTTEVPVHQDHNDRYDMGTEFEMLTAGYIKKVRLYAHESESGDHEIRLWKHNGSSYGLIAGPYIWSFSAGIRGWREYDLPSSIAVEANVNYILSITNGPDLYYVQSEDNFSPVASNSNFRYISGPYTDNLGSTPDLDWYGACYFRDIVFSASGANGNLTAGTIGNSQTICYSTTSAPLIQLTAPTGGTGVYTYQWQSSPDNAAWTNITGATISGYSPPALSASTYYRRTVTSGGYTPVNCTPLLITVYPQITLAQLHDNISINNNTSTNINVVIAGGTSPFTINYTRNGVAQTAINNYSSGTNISTGVLTTGVYTYALTSVTDAHGCVAQSLGTNITVTVTENSGSLYVPVDSLFRTETPLASSSDRLYELGTEFQTLSDGFITKVRLYSHINEGGAHIVRLWMLEGSSYTLIAGPYTWNFSSGVQDWREFELSSPIAVNANQTLIVAITNSTDLYYVKSEYFSSATSNEYVRYLRGLYTTSIGSVPSLEYHTSCYFRDIVFSTSGANGNLTAGTIGNSQTICYSTTPAPLIQLTAPTGGTGVYTYQWQSSPDNAAWTNITGATLSVYSPPVLTASWYYRRTVTSGSYTPVNSNSVLIAVSPQLALAQLHDNVTIYNNTSTNFNISFTGGTSPYTVNYTRNGATQTTITNYNSGTNISTGVLTTGVYTYILTSVTDAFGCDAQSLGNNISVTVSEDQGIITNSNKALVVVNSSSLYYSDYVDYISPYLNNFGIPYDVVNISTTGLPEFSEYAVIIFGHKNVYETGYPITQLEASISDGVGLYSFDSHLFDFPSGFNTMITQRSVNSNLISISNSTHYITQCHAPDIYSPTNNIINLLSYWTAVQNSNLVNGVDLATMSSSGQTVSLLQVSNYGNGKVVKWCGYDWVFENTLGPVYGMDDLLWRGIVWAARKPFAMQGLPPMITMRVDDVDGDGGGVTNNFEWIQICNEFGIIPWCGTFNNSIPASYIPTLKSLIDNNHATAFPHAFTTDQFIYYNHQGLTLFDAAANTRNARDFYIQNGLKISKYFVPHYYEISSTALSEVHAMGGEFIGIHMLPDNYYHTNPWLNCAPYRINRQGTDDGTRPVYYGGYVNLNGISFFNCLTEIRDDGGYEWYPDNNVTTTTARGIRHLRRSLNSMVLSSLFTHEYYFSDISTANWREILYQITSSISGYNPEFTSTDYAVQYIRARNNIRITNVRETFSNIEISYSGNNDFDTKCYLFTEQNGQITYRFVGLPQINGSNIVSVLK